MGGAVRDGGPRWSQLRRFRRRRRVGAAMAIRGHGPGLLARELPDGDHDHQHPLTRESHMRLFLSRRAARGSSTAAPPPRVASRTRRGSALLLALVLTFALGGLATSALYLSANTQMLTKLYDRERDYRYAA